MKTAVTIAGSDSSGGAGIQADIKTMIANGVYAMSAITALTAQNTTGVTGIMEVTPEFLGEELDNIFTDIYPDAVKIGMVSSGALIEKIADKLKEYQAKNIVVDPVMVATSGAKLISEEAIGTLKKRLLPIASVLTPNIPEAEVLAEMEIHSADDMIEAAKEISDTYHCAVLCKGGHKLNDANDLLYRDGDYRWFNGKRIDNPNTHGTGCTLSSAIASNLAKGFDMDTSVERAKDYISGALAAMLNLGKGSGPMDHGFAITGEYNKEAERGKDIMEEKRTGLFENGLIWFGAGVSIAEILTGTYLAPLGMGKGLLAIIVGHIIGCLMLFLAGVIGGKVRKSAMETVKMSFGQKGSILFAVLNVLQLVGWTAIMIYDGALAADGVMNTGRWIWCLVIGALIILWIVIGITNLGKINTVAMAALFILTLILCKVIFTGSGAGVPSDDSMTFGAAVELAVAMPLSWLPLISDYTREAKEPVKATAVSAITYGIVSCWMYVIGMGAAIITGEYDIAQIMLKAGLGIAGLLIIVFSTVTTTFLDAYSAGISSETVVNKWNGKHVAIVVTVLGTIAAIVYPMDNITDFLYLIGSVFAPMIAIQIADFFLLKLDKSNQAVHVPNMIIWVIGFIAYRILMNIDMPVGNTLPDMLITIILCLIVGKLFSVSKKR